MIYLRHDFVGNYKNAVKSGDYEYVASLILNEIGDIIVYKPNKIIALLNQVDIPTKDNASDEELVDKILNNISSSEKLRKGLGYVIADVNSVIDDGGNEWKKEVDSITEGIDYLAISIRNKSSYKSLLRGELMFQIKTKSKAVGDRQRNHYKPKTKIMNLVFLVGAGFGIYWLIKTLRNGRGS